MKPVLEFTGRGPGHIETHASDRHTREKLKATQLTGWAGGSERWGYRDSKTFDALVYTPYGGRMERNKFRGETDDTAAESRPAWCEISYGSKITDPKSFFTKKERLFVKAPDTFRVEVGHKIGMAVWASATFDISHEDACAPISVKLSDIYGPKDHACIYTGEVTEVSEQGSFLHNINSFRGCSGAVIFLLDQDQDVPKEVADGMAVGIHAGGLAEMGGTVNLALVLK